MEVRSLQSFLGSLIVQSREKRHPQSVTFELTYGCNLRCVHCLNPTHQALPAELRKDEVFRLLKEMAELGVLEIKFTGGELFTRPDLFEILDRAYELGFVLTILTNATRLSKEIVSKLQHLRTHLEVSIYGTTQAVYESVTGIPGSYGKFREGLELLSKSSLSVNLHIPVITLNYWELAQARDLAKSMGFGFQYCTGIHPRQDGNLEPLQYRLSPEDQLKIMSEMEAGPSSYALYGSKCSPTDRFIDCECGQSKFSITPYGEMNLCTAFPIPKYDLRRGTIREGWEVLKKTVDESLPNEKYHCPECDLKNYCRQGRSDSWLEKQDLSVCLPHFHALAGVEKEHYEPHLP